MLISKKLEGVVTINGTTSNKVKILTKDYIVYITFIIGLLNYPKYILNSKKNF
jgi:hypothetical protein